MRHAMLVAQIALAFVVVTGAALVTSSLVRLMSVDTGFDADGLLTGRLSLDSKLYPDPPQNQAYIDHLLASLRALPGVQSVAVANTAPFSEGPFDAPLYLDDSRTKRGAMMWMVTPGYFDTMRMRLLRGRWLSAFDGRAAPPAAVVDADFARRYFGDQDPLGHTITSPTLGDVRWTIVGVVSPVKFRRLTPEPWVGMYVPLAQLPAQPWQRMVRAISFVLRADGDPAALNPAIRSIAASLDKNQPVRDLSTLPLMIDKTSVQEPRFRTMLLGSLGLLALLLASVGIYGVFHYFVVQRTREIGVRVALGAQVRHVTGMILRQGLILAVPGVLIGLAGALALTRFLGSVLFEVKPRDPATFVVVTLVILAACCLACYLPARRAARIDPTEALRYE